MRKVVLILCSLLLFSKIHSQNNNSEKTIISGYLDFDNSIDTLAYLITNNNIKGNISTSNIKLNFEYQIGEIEAGIDIPEKGCITFVTSGTGMDSVEQFEFYNFDSKSSNWVHTKKVIISNNIDNGLLAPSIEFSYYNDSEKFETINGLNVEYIINKPKRDDIFDLIKEAKNKKNVRNRLIEYYFNYPINYSNIKVYNDLAHYLVDDSISLFLLEKITKKFPNRVVSFLNLADSYYNLGNETMAKKNYLKYIQLMKKQKKDLKKIPKYVYQRVK